MEAEETLIYSEKKEILVEDIDEDEEEHPLVEKFDFEEIVADDKSVASKIVDATCEEPELMQDSARLTKVVSAFDEQENNPLAIVVYKAPPQIIRTTDTTDDAGKKELLENEEQIDLEEEAYLPDKCAKSP
ncbi:hypothetical protein V6N13_042912 [Hibiscus sabdariffa]